MAKVEGQIETLKSIKRILQEKQISEFNSIADLNNFLKTFDSELTAMRAEEERGFHVELEKLRSSLEALSIAHRKLCETESQNVSDEISKLIARKDALKESVSRNWLSRLVYFLPLRLSRIRLANLANNRSSIFHKRTRISEEKVRKLSAEIEARCSNKEGMIAERILPKSRELMRVKEVVRELQPLIAGAIGEDLVVKEIRKLSEKFTLFNDFYVEFNPPIYNKKDNDRIYSVQIDHLLVSDSGIFIIETKHWSRNSVENLNLRSPVKQIMRASYALFVLLNGGKRGNGVSLTHHHWGNKQIPVRNLIVMINEKPKGAFQYVKVKTLKELNGYISHFERIFDDSEVTRITDSIRSLRVNR